MFVGFFILNLSVMDHSWIVRLLLLITAVIAVLAHVQSEDSKLDKCYDNCAGVANYEHCISACLENRGNL
ncbi:hypothetical protein Q1695_003806 [Nippostrongylus brasiliensis]|nr:hypothetical protein Q1695_003806 [Nippostrongylus brasiliensis]